MKFDINNKENLTNMYLIILTIIILYLLYRELTRKEGFGQTEDINAAINTRYGSDVEAIRNLSELATKLTTGGLTVPGNLQINGSLNMTGKNIDLGISDTSREVNAGKIEYGSFEPNSLCIVGKGTGMGSRTVGLWDNVNIYGSLNMIGKKIDLGINDTSREGNAGKIEYGSFEPNSLCIVGKGTGMGGRTVGLWDNLDVYGNINVKNDIMFDGPVDKTKWIIHTPDDMYISPAGPTGWAFGKGIQIDKNGNVSINANLTINGTLNNKPVP